MSGVGALARRRAPPVLLAPSGTRARSRSASRSRPLVLVILTVRSAESTSTRTNTAFSCPPSVTNDPASGFVATASRQVTADVITTGGSGSTTTYSDTVKGTGVAMVLVAFVLGATFIGAEFGVGVARHAARLRAAARPASSLVKALAVGIGLGAARGRAALVHRRAAMGGLAVARRRERSRRRMVRGTRRRHRPRRRGASRCGGIAAYAVTVVARRTVAAVAGLLIVRLRQLLPRLVGHWRWIAQDNPTNVFIGPRSSTRARRGATADTDFLLTAKAAAVGVRPLGRGADRVVAVVIFSRREVR